MARGSQSCRWCPYAGFVAVLLVGWFGFVHGNARPDLLRQRAEQAATADLAAAGFEWVKVRALGDRAELVGEAPSEDARRAAQAAAGPLLARYVGLPGVFAGIDARLEVAAAPAPAVAAAASAAEDAEVPAPVAVAAASAAPPAASGRPMATKPVVAAEVSPPAGARPAASATPPAADALLRPDPQCQRELVDLQQSEVLHFRAGAATLDLGQEARLDQLASLLKRCDVGRVLVHGLRETSSLASASAEKASAAGQGEAVMGPLLLAQRRAQALRAELIARGIAPARLELGASAREVASDEQPRVQLTLAPQARGRNP